MFLYIFVNIWEKYMCCVYVVVYVWALFLFYFYIFFKCFLCWTNYALPCSSLRRAVLLWNSPRGISSLADGTSLVGSPTITSIWDGFDKNGLIRPWARKTRRRNFGAMLAWICWITSESTSRPFASAFPIAFLSKSKICSHDLIGHLPLSVPNSFAWPVRPICLLNRRMGIHLLWSLTASRYSIALLTFIWLIAAHVSRVGLNRTRR